MDLELENITRHRHGSSLSVIAAGGIIALLSLTLWVLFPPAALASPAPGSIEGEVTSSSGHSGIEAVEVCAYPIGASELEHACAFTDATGSYTIPNLPAGRYTVEFWAATETLNYLTQYYDDKSSYEEADPVSVAGESTTRDVDAEMREGAEIKGEVTGSSNHDPLGEILVCAAEASSRFERCVLSNPEGEYTLSGLPTGQYTIEFWAGLTGLNYLPQYYDGKAGVAEAEGVSVEVEETKSNIDAGLEEGGQISGTVIDAATTAALPQIEVCAIEGSEAVACTLTDAAGNYTIPALPSGAYRVDFNPHEEGEASEYLTQYYNEKPTLAEADSISVTVPKTRIGIDARLIPISTLVPAVSEAPLLSGATNPDGILFCSTGAWSNNPASYSYQWLADGAPIALQSKSTYLVQTTDEGKAIACRVKANNHYGSATATSNIVQVPVPTDSTPIPPPRAPTPLKCRRGFRRAKLHGRSRCVKAKRPRRHRHR